MAGLTNDGSEYIEQASLRHRRAMVLAFPHAVLEVLAVLREPYQLFELSLPSGVIRKDAPQRATTRKSKTYTSSVGIRVF